MQLILTCCHLFVCVEIPLADGGSLSTGPNADGQVSYELDRLPKPTWRIGKY